MEPVNDHYWILGINKDATERDIRVSYKQLALVHHPDKNPGDASATLNFRMIQEAYEVLVDTEKRENYDAECHLYGVKKTRFHAAQYTENPLKAAANRKEQDRLQNLAAERIKADRERLRKEAERQESERKAAEHKERLQRLAEERRKEAERQESERKAAEHEERLRRLAEERRKEAEREEAERIESERQGAESAKTILEMLEKLAAENNVSWKKSCGKLTGIKVKAKGTKIDMQREKLRMISAKAIQESLQRAHNHLQKAGENIAEAKLRIDSEEFSTKQEQFGATDENNTAEGLYTEEQDVPSWTRGQYWERTPDSKTWSQPKVPNRPAEGEAVGGTDDSEINEEQWKTAGGEWETAGGEWETAGGKYYTKRGTREKGWRAREEYGKKKNKQETMGGPSVPRSWADLLRPKGPRGGECGGKEEVFPKPKGWDWGEECSTKPEKGEGWTEKEEDFFKPDSWGWGEEYSTKPKTKGDGWNEKKEDFLKPEGEGWGEGYFTKPRKGGEWSEKEEDFLIQLKNEGMEWKMVAINITQRFGHSRSPQACSGKYRKLKDQGKVNYSGW